jgi:hypothetical protein
LFLAEAPIPFSGSPATIARVGIDGSGFNGSFVTLPHPSCTSGLIAGATALAVDGSHIYWADTTLGTIGRANIADGSTPNVQLIRGAGGACGTPGTGAGPEGVAVDATHVYWTNPDQGTIGRAGLDGTTPTQSFITGAQEPSGIAVAGSNIYWANSPGTGQAGTIGHATLDGSGALNPTSVNESFITGVQGFGPTSVAVAAGFVYFDNGDGWIGRATLDGSIVARHIAQFGTTGNPITSLAADASQSTPTATAVSCLPSSLQVLDPFFARANVQVSPHDTAVCTFTVRDTIGPAHPAGVVSAASTPPELAFFAAANHQTVQRTCELRPSGVIGQASCSLAAQTDSLMAGYAPNRPVTLTAVYGGESLHTASGGSTSIPLRTVYGCGFVGDGFAEICDANGFVLIGGPRGKGGHTTSTTFAIGKAHVTVTVPRDCVAPHSTFSVRVSFRGRLSVRRVQLILRSRRVTLTRAPYVARFKDPSGRNGDYLVITARVTTGPRHGRQTTKTVQVPLYVC